jgi:nitroreductase
MSIIYRRRSIRKYQKKDVPDELVKEIIRAAMHAPSACNQQPWHFVVIRNEETKKKIAEIHPHAQMSAEAPVVILVCGDPTLEKVKAFRELLGIPEHVVPFAIVPVGYPAEQPAQVDRFKPERIHYEKW